MGALKYIDVLREFYLEQVVEIVPLVAVAWRSDLLVSLSLSLEIPSHARCTKK